MSVQAAVTYEAMEKMEFQYILCVGSRIGEDGKVEKVTGFNTSYVSVQERWRVGYQVGKYVSIHLMCRFKLLQTGVHKAPELFQYILCVGSSRY